ncbi:MAG: hypothetical protein ACI83W_000340 [Marinoscillum sp.]|jgi:hypothetical protein
MLYQNITYEKNIYYFFHLSSFIFLTQNSYAQNLQISGPNEMCPGQSYTYTASTSTAGHFQWNVRENGLWRHVYGGSQPCGPNSPFQTFSSYTFPQTVH